MLVGAQPHVALGLAVVHSTRREVVRLVLNQGPQLRAHLLRKQPRVHHSAVDGVAARCTQWGEKKDGCSQCWVGKQGYRVFLLYIKQIHYIWYVYCNLFMKGLCPVVGGK